MTAYLFMFLIAFRESDLSAVFRKTPSECPVNKPTVSSTGESARVKDPNFIALTKAQPDVKFFVYMNGVGCWKKSA